MRGFIVVLLIVLGGIVSIPGFVTIWAEQQVLNEDNFVDTINETLEQEEVKIAVAETMTVVLMEQLEVQERIGQGLENLESQRDGEREILPLLEVPLTVVAKDVIFEVSFRIVDSDVVAEVRDLSLRGAHQVVSAIINEDGELLATVGDTLVLDISWMLEEVVRDVGGDRADELLDTLDIPEDKGVIVLAEKSDLEPIWSIAQVIKVGSPWTLVAAGVLFALAIAIAQRRRRVVVSTGVVIAVTAGLVGLLIAEPLKEITVDALSTSTSGRDAALVAYDTIVNAFLRQQAIIMFIGVGLAVGASLQVDTVFSGVVRSLRGKTDETGAGDQTSILDWISERTVALRISGLGLAGLFLVTWPDLSTRLIVTVVVLVALYLLALTIATSDAGWAVSTRGRIADVWERYFRVDQTSPAETRPGVSGWITARAHWFRIIGILAGIVFLITWPSVTFGLVVIVFALELIYLAAIDFVGNRGTS